MRLLGISWDKPEPDDTLSYVFSPILIVELAQPTTPTLDVYYHSQSMACDKPRALSIGLGFVADIADGLSALQAYEVVHGDVKPENMLLFPDPDAPGTLVVKLSDFGFCNLLVLNEVRRGGSRFWDPPECVVNSTPEARSYASSPPRDVYAFGLVAAWVAFAGEFPVDLAGLSMDELDRCKVQNLVKEMVVESLSRSATTQWISEEGRRAKDAYIALVNDTLHADPLGRLKKLDGIRLRLFGKYVARYFSPALQVVISIWFI